jgi:hypothetical protein
LKKNWTLLIDFFSFLGPKTHFCKGRHENKEKHIFYFGLRILSPIQIELLETENPKDPKNQKIKKSTFIIPDSSHGDMYIVQ